MRKIIVAVAVVVLAGAEKPDDAVKKELAELDGTWVLVSGEREGMPLTDNVIKDSKRVCKNGETTVTIQGMLFMKAKFTVDPSKKPKTIDYEIIDGPNKGKTQAGVYELDGDTVKFCFTAPGAERPTDLTAKAGSGRTLSVWKRDKK